MKQSLLKKVWKNWFLAVTAAVIGVQALVYLVFGENSYITVQDNLDLFVGHFQAMKHADAFFGQGKTVPILGGISRDYLSSEFNLYNIWYAFLPPFAAYMVGYFLKIFIGLGSCIYLGKEIYQENYSKYRPLICVLGLTYGILPLFPAYGIAFASIPLVVAWLRAIYLGKGKRYYLYVFLYPLLSYFSYFGFFILGYLAVTLIYVSIKNKKWNLRLTGALFLLAAGYMVFEYRLFKEMLFGTTETIRETMLETSLDLKGVLSSIWEAFSVSIFHAKPQHTWFVLPVCVIFLLYLIVSLVRKKEGKKIFKEPFFWIFAFIVFNCVIYGVYFFEGFRWLFETLLPPLKGFQFNRTVFFNPLLWYIAFFLVLKFLYDKNKKTIANLMACAAVAVALFTPAFYNEFYSTIYHQAYRILKQTEVNTLNWREYYSEDLMEAIKEDIDYQGEYAAAYGLNPAVLSYSGIATLDGYLGFYPQSYKDDFTVMVQPALERVEEWRTYYGDWGARAYIFSGSGENTWNPYRELSVSDDRLYINADMFRQLGGTYLFSRFEISNAEELGFSLKGVYEGYGSPYTVYLYVTA